MLLQRSLKRFWAFMICAALLAAAAVPLPAAAIVSGFDTNVLPPNDDGSSGSTSLGFTADFFGTSFSSVFVNNNGNLTFTGPLSSFTPFDLTRAALPIIAPFFADVDTSRAGSPVTYGTGTFDGQTAFGVNWINVDFFPSDPQNSDRNSFQLILVNRADIAPGDFDIIFNYDQIQWESSASSNVSARAGFANGTQASGTFFELPGSAILGAFLDGGPNALAFNSLNSPVVGRYIFEARNGVVDVAPAAVPEPGSLVVLTLGACGLAIRTTVRRRKQASN